MRRGRNHVGSDAADLDVVHPQIGLPHPLGEIVQQGKAGNAFSNQTDDGIRQVRVGDGRGGNRIDTVGQPLDDAVEISGRLRRREFTARRSRS